MQGFLLHAQQGIDAAGVVQQHGVAGVEREDPLQQAKALFALVQENQVIRSHVQGPGIAGIELQEALGYGLPASAQGARQFGTAQVGIGPCGEQDRNRRLRHCGFGGAAGIPTARAGACSIGLGHADARKHPRKPPTHRIQLKRSFRIAVYYSFFVPYRSAKTWKSCS